jgi:hypothetical protein
MKIINKTIHTNRWMLLLGILIILGWPLMTASAESDAKASFPVIKSALMCEGVRDGLPVNQTIIFNVSSSSAYCWSEFDPVPVDGVVYHEWYRRGVLITRKKLAVHTPRWATYSRLPLRQADIGPWHLNITDENGSILKTLRFSITE